MSEPEFTIVVDTRETYPYTFMGLEGDSPKYEPPVVHTVERALKTGDYSIEGLEDKIVIERKSKSDLYQTLGQGRDRFKSEHERMKAIVESGGLAVVVVEDSWSGILNNPPKHSQLLPKVVFRTALAWHCKYGVPWMTFEGRALAEVYVYRFLEKYWLYHGKERKSQDTSQKD